MPPPRELDLATLREWTDADRDFLLLDVLPAAVHAEWRIPASRNACVYEVTFAEQVGALRADHAAPVVAYDSGPAFHAAEDACTRLVDLGFQNVYWFRGGREEWSAAGLPAEGTAADRPWQSAVIAKPAAGIHRLDPEASCVLWHGRNAANGHHGRLRFKEGWIEVDDGGPVAGNAVIDMHTITCDSLKGEMAEGLLRHLATGDFFLTDRFPTAAFTLDVARPISGSTPGRPNLEVEGRMEIRGADHPIRFPAVFAASGDGRVALQGSFELDRTLWGSRYGSGRLYDRLGMHLVNDEVSLQVRLVGSKPDA